MRKGFSLLITISIAFVCVATRETTAAIHLDNFEQFATGTVLTDANYLPATGTSVAITNYPGGIYSAVATNLFGSQGAYFSVAPQSAGYDAAYLNVLSQTYSNTTLTLTWNAMAQPAEAGTSFYSVLLDSQPSPPVPYFEYDQYSYFLSFADGQVLSWTNFEGAKVIGTYTMGALTTNRLDLNLAAGTYTFYLNGALVVADEPMPTDYMVTDSVTRFGFQFLNLGTTSPTEFFLDDVELTSIPEPSVLLLATAGVFAYVVARRRR